MATVLLDSAAVEERKPIDKHCLCMQTCLQNTVALSTLQAEEIYLFYMAHGGPEAGMLRGCRLRSPSSSGLPFRELGGLKQ